VLELAPRATAAAERAATPRPAAPAIETRALSVHAGDRPLLRDVNLAIEPARVLAIVGPSGAGKTTLLRCLNRMNDLTPGLRVSGEVRVAGGSIYARGVDVDQLRARVGMIFQQPVIFPGSVLDNVLFGVRHTGLLPRRAWRARAEAALREAALWPEVADRLGLPGKSLSVGQQQRLCLARALACEPDVLLLDEPTSALDPRSSAAIEELILRLKERQTIVLVTHNLGQARRVADAIVCLAVRDGAGEIAESGCCADVLDRPRSRELAHFLSGGR
jgi:phosphate transport system ATP-binding protein